MQPDTTHSELPLASAAASPSTSLEPPHTRYRRYLNATVTWVRGPIPPVDITFSPVFPAFQRWPSQAFVYHFKRRRSQVMALVVYLLVWLVLFMVVVHYSRFADTVEGVAPIHLGCGVSLWARNNLCGIDGDAYGQVLNPRAVGEKVVAYRTFVVGGPTDDQSNATYRADSFICPSAIHAGIVSKRYGGCGILTRTGSASNFPSSDRHDIESIGFDATFPSSYTFVSGVKSSACTDLRWHLFAVSIPFTILISVVSPVAIVPFYATFVGVFFHVALASDPPFLTNPYDTISQALARFLPAAFIAHFIWLYILQRPHSRAPKVERTIWYLGGLWVGALTNITFNSVIPINRLTGRDLDQQPGAKAALAVIVVVLCLIVVAQGYYNRLSGQLPKMLGIYGGIGTGLGLLAAIPGTSLRIHHYILALLLLPGCKLLTRPSLLYQGLLVGLFIDGTARWGFAGVVETPESLIGDGLYYSSIPRFEPAPAVNPANITVFWPPPPENLVGSGGSYDVTGLSVIVNDVERYRWRGGGGDNSSVGGEFTFLRVEGERSYVRLAWMVRGGDTLDYTRAGVVEPDGAWREPAKGLS